MTVSVANDDGRLATPEALPVLSAIDIMWSRGSGADVTKCIPGPLGGRRDRVVRLGAPYLPGGHDLEVAGSGARSGAGGAEVTHA